MSSHDESNITDNIPSLVRLPCSSLVVLAVSGMENQNDRFLLLGLARPDYLSPVGGKLPCFTHLL